MPIYEYKCADCGAHVEKMQKIFDAPLTVCEVCGGKLEKQWSLSGFQLNGAGWYVTDSSTKTKDAGADKSSASENSEKAEKTEKTSAAESTAKTETASKETKNDAVNSKKETVVKSD
ncbi:MAG: FmdB family zinc ribbon protein [Pyrinomonadaceae bacterium]